MTTPPESPVYAAILEGIVLREQGRPTDAKALMEPLVADVESGEDAVERGNAGGKNALLPSLHLNLAEDYRRLGDEAGAHRHFELGKAYLEALSGDAYGDSIRSAFAAWRSSS